MGRGHALGQLLRVFADEFRRGARVGIGIVHAGRDGRFDGAGQLHGHVAAHGDGAQRQGRMIGGFPPLPQVQQLHQAAVGIGETAFMDDDAHVRFAGEHRIHDIAEEHLFARALEAAVQGQQQVGRGHEARHGHAGRFPFFFGQVLAGHHQRAAAPAQGGARGHDGIIVHDVGHHAQRKFGHRQLLLPGKGIELLHVGHVRREVRRGRHQMVQQGMEDIGIIGTGRKAQRHVLRHGTPLFV